MCCKNCNCKNVDSASANLGSVAQSEPKGIEAKIVKRLGFLSSSADPEKIATTWKGLLGAIGTILLILAPSLGLDLSGIDFNQLAEAGYHLVVNVSAVLSGVAVLYGGLRKIFYSLFPKK